jgi:hypothetical protein
MYSAIELMTTKVMWNIPAFLEFQRSNLWTKDFLPHCTPSIDSTIVLPQSRSLLQRTMEMILNFFPLAMLNRFLMNRYKRHWDTHYQNLNEKKRASSFMTSPNAASVWKIDYHELIMRKLRDKLTELGLKESYD